jgi:hypothetical protein
LIEAEESAPEGLEEDSEVRWSASEMNHARRGQGGDGADGRRTSVGKAK